MIQSFGKRQESDVGPKILSPHKPPRGKVSVPPESFRALACAQAGVTAVLACSARAFGRHTHDQFGIGVIDAGAQTSHSGRGQVQAGAGDLITVNPNEVHDGLPIAAAPRRWRMLYFDPAVIAAAADAPQEFCWPTLAAPAQSARFNRLFAAMTETDAPLARETDLLLLIEAMQDRARRSPPPARVSAACQRLADDPATPITLTDLANLTGTSRFHFLRSFAAATGLTPHAFQIQQRLHLARRLILTRMPLAEVAAAAGFADQSHLTRLFRRSYGLTPKAYAAAAR